jgi:mRNA interferase HigB
MRVISKSRLKLFWEALGHQGADGPLLAWHNHVNSKTVAWHSWGDVKADFANASTVGNCAVFNIGGNKYRLVTRILYRSQKVYVLRVMTHKEYDDGKWKEQCGCFTPPPETKAVGGSAPKQKRRGD